jgi:hypothetical protein
MDGLRRTVEGVGSGLHTAEVFLPMGGRSGGEESPSGSYAMAARKV